MDSVLGRVGCLFMLLPSRRSHALYRVFVSALVWSTPRMTLTRHEAHPIGALKLVEVGDLQGELDRDGVPIQEGFDRVVIGDVPELPSMSSMLGRHPWFLSALIRMLRFSAIPIGACCSWLAAHSARTAVGRSYATVRRRVPRDRTAATHTAAGRGVASRLLVVVWLSGRRGCPAHAAGGTSDEGASRCSRSAITVHLLPARLHQPQTCSSRCCQGEPTAAWPPPPSPSPPWHTRPRVPSW
jgi:hypothetical protein